jgi:thiol-disulfide isomerase/thioredoxin
MRFLLPVLLAVSLSISAAFAQPAPRRAPDLAIHRIGQPDLRLSDYKGKVVLLAFLNTGCTHCQHFAQELGGLQKDYGPKGVQVLAVVFDTGAKDGLAAFREKYVRGFPIGYSDEATVLSWLQQRPEDGYFVPIVAFIDRRGAITSQHLGDDNLFQDPEANIRRQLDRMLKPGAGR